MLPSGEVVDLVARSGVISRGENTVINNEGKTLSYKSIGNQAPMDSLRYNEVIVPKGGEYQLVLSDGTLVYLNSMTKVRFPERFSEKCREVEVCGEAFFEVTKNKDVPFIVKTGGYEITVLGTKFNVTAYADEHVITTTLVEGVVSISGKCIGAARTLWPNEQLVLDQVMAAFFGFFYVAVMLSYVYQIRTLERGLYLAFLVFLCSWGCDTCAYCVGMLIGKHKMSPKLSPKKSVEGAVGGVAGAALLTALYCFIFRSPMHLERGEIVILAVIAAIAGLISMVGDLTASAIKRNYDIKDYGKLIPGHGGILDRFDSMIITAPIIYFLALHML